MASEAILDLEILLQPVSEEKPVGDDIRDNPSPTSPYFVIKDARNAARSAERNHMFDNDTSEADQHWRTILEKAPDIIQNHAKDLEIASWLTEALVRRYGFQGLRDGFKLIHGLISQYWDNLYPLPDEDGIETRVASLTGLNGEGSEGVLIAPIRNVYITASGNPEPYSYWKYQQVLEIEKVINEEEKRDKASKLGFSLDDINDAVAQSDDTFYINLTDDIGDALETYRDIGRMLDEYCGIQESPPTSNIINILQDCLGTIRHIAKYKLPDPESDSQDASDGVDDMQSDNNPLSPDAKNSPSGPINNRAEAFKKLKEISDFFRRTEPHSPISYIIERAVNWGDMPLESLIKELIPDPSARNVFGSLTGVKTEDDYN